MVYVTHPEGELWRARADGSDRVRLLSAPLQASNVHWSPDGRTLVLQVRQPGALTGVFMMPATGGTLVPIFDRTRASSTPAWSADGSSLVLRSGGRLHIVDVKTHESRPLHESESMMQPQWSPDGRFIAASDWEGGRLMLYDVSAARWSTLAATLAIGPVWTRDSRHVVFWNATWWDRSLDARSTSKSGILRASVPDGRIERLVELDDVRLVWGAYEYWVGLDPTGAPLLLRDLSIHHLYSLDWRP